MAGVGNSCGRLSGVLPSEAIGEPKWCLLCFKPGDPAKRDGTRDLEGPHHGPVRGGAAVAGGGLPATLCTMSSPGAVAEHPRPAVRRQLSTSLMFPQPSSVKSSGKSRATSDLLTS